MNKGFAIVSKDADFHEMSFIHGEGTIEERCEELRNLRAPPWGWTTRSAPRVPTWTGHEGIRGPR